MVGRRSNSTTSNSGRSSGQSGHSFTTTGFGTGTLTTGEHRGTPFWPDTYPDPERTLERDYLGRHASGPWWLLGPTREVAATSSLPGRCGGVYEVYAVIDPVNGHIRRSERCVTRVRQSTNRCAERQFRAPVTARVNWHPRWEATVKRAGRSRPFARWVHRNRTETNQYHGQS